MGAPARRPSHSSAKKVIISHFYLDHASTSVTILFNLQLFHEELVLQWIVVHPSSRPPVLRNAWFFFEILVIWIIKSITQFSQFYLSLSHTQIYTQIKAMAQHLNNSDKLNSQRSDRFSTKFMEDLDTLVGSIAMEICNKHVQVF